MRCAIVMHSVKEGISCFCIAWYRRPGQQLRAFRQPIVCKSGDDMNKVNSTSITSVKKANRHSNFLRFSVVQITCHGSLSASLAAEYAF